MADLYAKRLETERKALWATCRLKGLAVVLASLPTAALAGPCLQWQPAERIGSLNAAFLREASGMAASRVYPGRLYHHNDSGDGPYFYITDAKGHGTRRVTVSGFAPRDVEDMALGRCRGPRSCLILGDIGDNARSRTTVKFVEVAERAAFPREVAPLRVVEARYPDGPHNAESFALRPNGDLYLLTKALDLKAGRSGPAEIYRLTAAQMSASPGKLQTFAHVGTLDLPAMVPNMFAAQVATAMDISRDGQRVVVLTYGNVLEWQHDLSKPLGAGRRLKAGADYTVTPLPRLMQAEAIAYLPNADGILFTTELTPPDTAAPLYRQMCLRREASTRRRTHH